MRKCLTTMLVALLGMAGAAHAGEPERYSLQIKAHPGERYLDEFLLTTSKSVPQIGFESRSLTKITSQSDVESVQANGRIALTQRVLDFRLVYHEPGREVVIDSADSELFAAMRQDKELGPVVRDMEKNMKAPVRTVLEPTSAVRRFDAGGSSAGNVLEQAMTSGMLLLPEKPVALHESWTSKAVSVEPSTLGHAEISLTMTLRRIAQLNGEQVAYIDIKGELVSFTPDRESGARVTIKQYESKGLLLLALVRGRIVSYTQHGFRDYGVVENGEEMILRVGFDLMEKEKK